MSISFVAFEDNFDENYTEDVSFEDIIIKKEEKKENTIQYDKMTSEKYRVYRLRKLDPISWIEVDEDYAFKFHHVWDPYTGERKGLDENGPLYFDPDMLIWHFLTKLLNKLWVQPSDEKGGYYEGYYDDGAGAGDDFYLPSRGHHPEWYLFRLPITNCYLTIDHNNQYITFGPKLTNEEVLEIDRLAKKRPNNFKEIFGRQRPSLIEMKRWYDQAISKTPILDCDTENLSTEDLQNLYNRANRQAIDQLVKISSSLK
ncbi:hypothetical protein Indivirus_1_80 [Indivirus ILV1]|uniref:Uncharacterized protein n=1 Tax=Indivirus ILV1 TaxID=1977633 RepID=A0A1V0SCL4_9VIRU|nr:hypothetical protein Indivirus_1_80 [Indivirus ILV1]